MTTQATDRRRCAHEACGCAAPEGAGYCSGYCSNVDADDSPDAALAACACGHAACAESQRVPASGRAVVTALGGGPGRNAGGDAGDPSDGA